jgi:hypothetical protein
MAVSVRAGQDHLERRCLCLFTAVAAAQTTTKLPEGRAERTAQAFRPGKDTHNELALKLKGRPNRDWSQRGDTSLFAFHVRNRFHTLCTRISLLRPRIRPPLQLQGDSAWDDLPRPEGLGCSVFALRAIKSKRGPALNRHR